MKLLVVGRGAPERGGIPTFLNWLVTTATANGATVDFVNLSPGTDTPGGRWRLTNLTRSFRDVASVARRTSTGDIVHVHSAMAPASTMIRAAVLCAAARARGGRVLLHVHGGRLPLWVTTRVRTVLLRVCTSTAHHVAAVSGDTYRTVADVTGSSRTTLIRNGVDTVTFHPGGAHEVRAAPVILYVGHLSPRKGVGDLLDATARLSETGVEHTLMIVGGAPDEGASHAVNVDPRQFPTVQLRGPQPTEAMPDLYREADVLCLPSWWEAMPLSVLEGMATGLPVVATDVGDIHTAVVAGRHGFLVPPRAPDQLASALSTLLHDEELRTKMGRAARETAELDWSAEATWKQIVTTYQRLERS